MTQPALPKIELEEGEALVLRTCNQDGTSYLGFQWPKAGPVAAPDWKPVAECGHGLHGLLWGQGGGELLNWSSPAWLVVRVRLKDVVTIDEDAVKFPASTVEYFGECQTALDLMAAHAPSGTVIVGRTITSGANGKSVSGYCGTATSGDGGQSVSGDGGTSVSGNRGQSTSGERGMSVSGVCGVSVSGMYGTSVSESCGISVSGGHGLSTSGLGGAAASGVSGCISIFYWQGPKYRRAVFAVGENGIEPNTPYQVDEQGRPVKVTADIRIASLAPMTK